MDGELEFHQVAEPFVFFTNHLTEVVGQTNVTVHFNSLSGVVM